MRHTPIVPPLSQLYLLGLFLGLFLSARPVPASDHFEKHIRPLLVEKCQSCHGEKKAKGGLRLDSRAAMVKGGDSGPVVVPGKPDESLLIQAVRQSGSLKMPPKGKL
ncbi:MAG: c-type cytochrome domain-containing protein, partial [Gemmataceae bacterium]